ncbi:MAG: L-2-amino-thiazoline-4-carboxylic acid hydrolase [Deltaproteobacteria bacterium]|nr:L-2-amino-thiazoline-4-carboxylic acid hydrolase [Deltaproteobacteria bacterium]
MTSVPEITVTLLERRRIEAEILKHVHDALVEDVGEERAKASIAKAIRRAAAEAGAKAAAKTGGKPGTRSLAAIQGTWSAGGALELEVTELTDTAYSYKVTRCVYAEMYEELGMRDLGLVISCLRDSAFIEGYAPDLEMERPRTIMEGKDSCVFRYKVKEGK